MSARQVLTKHDGSQFKKATTDQAPMPVRGTISNVVASLIVKGQPPRTRNPTPQRAPSQAASEGSRGRLGATKAQRGRSAKNRGGWPNTACFSWDEVKKIDNAIHELSRGGCGPTHHITIMPLTGNPSSRKRTCSREIAHLGQALKRHGESHVGITIFENPPNADLHAHHLVFVPHDEYATVERLHRPPEVHVERISNLDGIVDYITKERRHLSPDFEAMIERRWERSLPVPGKRWTMTTEAKELLARSELKVA